MDSNPPLNRGERVTARGLQMLDELGVALIECQLALRSMRLDVGLTLDELQRDLVRARESARLAFTAAHLLHQEADLAASWTDYPSRPKAILARHRVAVDYGAPRKVPAVTTAERYEETIFTPVDASLGPPATRRRCASRSSREGTSCRRRVARIGHDDFADHCPDHLDDEETRLLDEHRRDMAAIVIKAQREEFGRISEEWLTRRRALRPWLEQAAGANEDDG